VKKCNDCKKEKELIDFSEDKKRNRRLSNCKKCMAKRTEAYRQLHKDKWRKSSKKHSIKFMILIKEWKSQGCAKCNDKRYYVLDAHHLDPSKKDFSIGTSMRGLKITIEELKKCIPICSNCHREFHYLEKLNKITIQEYLNHETSRPLQT